MPAFLPFALPGLHFAHACQLHGTCYYLRAGETCIASAGLVDDDFGMELLVSGNIISLSLPVRLVWECVWRPTLPSSDTEDPGQLPIAHLLTRQSNYPPCLIKT